MPIADHAAALRTVDHLLRALLALAVVALLSLPAARGHDALLGWMPGWLVGLPLASWCALRVVMARLPGAAARHPSVAFRRVAVPVAPRSRRPAARRLRRAA